jgi:hypothetical protein
MCVKGIGCDVVDLIQLPQHRFLLRAFVNTVMNILGFTKGGNSPAERQSASQGLCSMALVYLEYNSDSELLGNKNIFV